MNRDIIVNNLHVKYFEIGKGSAALFLHGWGADANSFNSILNQLKDFRCISLSLPGFGGSQKPSEDWGVFEYSAFVRDFIEKLQIEPIIIIGHSFGGRVAIKGISKELLKPQKLVLIASAGASRKSFGSIIISLVAKVAHLFSFIPPLRSMINKMKSILGSDDYKNSGDMRNIFLKVVNENLESDAKCIKIPTLLIWGEEDQTTTLVEARRLKAAISSSNLKIFPGAGHYVFKDEYVKVAKEIREFAC